MRKQPTVVIIGGGPGGMAAGIWAVRLGLRPRILEAGGALGGQLREVFGRVPDYPGIPDLDGPELAARFADHVRSLDVPVELGARAVRLDVDGPAVTLDDGRTLAGDAVILATGVARRRLGVPGERRFAGGALSYSVRKDVGRVGGLETAVVGGGDAAFEGVQLLAPEVEVVHLIHRATLRARPDFRAAVAALPNVVAHPGRSVVAVDGDDELRGVRLDDGSRVRCARLFVRIGVEPQVVDDGGRLPRDGRGYLRPDRSCRCGGAVYAVGDIGCPEAMSVSVAVGHAMIACKHIQRRWL